MTISIIGTGYVGLVTGAIFADLGHKVFCVDTDQNKINLLKKGSTPFYEPGLEEIVRRSSDQKRLIFTTSYTEAVPQSKVVFICVGTPSKNDGGVDTGYLFSAVEETAKHLHGYTLIAIKSTVPIGVEKDLQEVIKKNSKAKYEFASCPEFLREGSAVFDSRNPDRIIIGTNSKKASDILLDLYKHFNGQRIICDLRSAQMIKYASNTFLATKISFANAIANLSEMLGANAVKVLEGVGSDQRIGKSFLSPGVGYGGSCFPKDVAGFKDIAQKIGYDFDLLKAVEKINNDQIDHFISKIIKLLGDLKDKNICILGLSFKPNTDDIREAPSIKIIQKLLKYGANIKAYDPIAANNVRKIFKEEITLTTNAYEAVENTEAVLIVTEWDEFKELDLAKVKRLMKKTIIFDGRNIYDPQKLKLLGFHYQGIGQS